MESITPSIHRRQFVRLGALSIAGVACSRGAPQADAVASAAAAASYQLAPLPYAYAALEPVIDAKTMEIHHGKHHAAYVAGLNAAVSNQPALQGKSLEVLLAALPEIQDGAVRGAVRNHGGGHWNHRCFWESLAPVTEAAKRKPSAALEQALTAAFGSFAGFQAAFADAAAKRFGSGWAWLIYQPGTKSLKVTSTANQDNPLMRQIVPDDEVGVPLLGLDVWEHAYYLRYQNRRADYISAWWGIVDWNRVSQQYHTAASA